MPIRWGSTHLMIKSLLVNQRAFKLYTSHLEKKKKKSPINLDEEDFRNMKSLNNILSIFFSELLKVTFKILPRNLKQKFILLIFSYVKKTQQHLCIYQL